MQLTPAWLLGLCAPVVMAQTDVSVTAIVGPYTPACSFSSVNSLNLGSYYRPWTDTGSVAMDAQTGLAQATGMGVVTGSAPQVGSATVTALHASSITVTVSFPDKLSSGDETVTFGSGQWARRTNDEWDLISGLSYNVSGPGQGGSYTADLRFGGTVSGITRDTEPGAYEDAISATIACS